MAKIEVEDTATSLFAAGSNSLRSLTLRNIGTTDLYYAWRSTVIADDGATDVLPLCGMLLKPDETIIYERSGVNLSAELFGIATAGDTAQVLVEPCHG